MYDLKGRVAVVTGSGRGIGRAIGLRLAAEGCRLVFNAKKRVEELEESLRLAREHGVDVLGVLADVSTPEGCDLLLRRTVDGFGGVDILVNNAGLGLFSPFLSLDEALLEKQFSTDFRSIVYVTQRFAGKMSDGGVILNVSSVAAEHPVMGLSIYGAMKSAVNTLTKYLAVELAPRLRVNAIAPGWVNTRLGTSMPKLLGITVEEFAKKFTLTGKILEPEDVAEIAVAIMKLESVTGQVVYIDSGETLVTHY
jgi:3-oxoacyl-[acyl-carrier protein] reductase